MSAPDVMFQYRGLGGKPGAMLMWVRKVEGGFIPGFELFEGVDERHAVGAALLRRTELAADASIERVVVGIVHQELRRKEIERDGKIVLPFNRARKPKVNGS